MRPTPAAPRRAAATAFAMLVLAACAGQPGRDDLAGAGNAPPVGSPPAARRAAPAVPEECAPERVEALVRQFADAYSRGDLPALHGLFATDAQFFEYFDALPGQRAAHIRGAAQVPEWEDHLRARFALDDRLVVGAMRHHAGYAEADVTRSWGPAPRAARRASAKMVCEAGRLMRVVMNTLPA